MILTKEYIEYNRKNDDDKYDNIKNKPYIHIHTHTIKIDRGGIYILKKTNNQLHKHQRMSD